MFTGYLLSVHRNYEFKKMSLWEELAAEISCATGRPFHIERRDALSGGCINSAYRVCDGLRCLFVKLNSAEHKLTFEAEFAGLQALAGSGICVPTPVASGVVAGQAFLVTEYIAMSGRGDPVQFGRQLAQMHQTKQSLFGWYRNNTIGATPQINEQESDWVTFLQRHRFGYQLQLAMNKNGGQKIHDLGLRLIAELPSFFESYHPEPSLLHGDLWGGNYAYNDRGDAVIFDPAVYYGDREADIAMTELFGGFSPEFYAGYAEEWPLDRGYSMRKNLYNLYHIINHFNLFGGGYGAQAEGMIQQLLSEIH